MPKRMLCCAALVLALPGCTGKCERLKNQFKEISAEGAALARGDIFDPGALDKVQDLSRRSAELQNDAIQAECPLEEIVGTRATGWGGMR